MTTSPGSAFDGTIGETVVDSTPHWPAEPTPPAGAPNILLMMLDDVGFADFGCYGSEIDTPNIDALAARGVKFSGFHTTAMCSTTRASLHTGRNHHSVGMGCLANFDSGFPGTAARSTPTPRPSPRCCGLMAIATTTWASGTARH